MKYTLIWAWVSIFPRRGVCRICISRLAVLSGLPIFRFSRCRRQLLRLPDHMFLSEYHLGCSSADLERCDEALEELGNTLADHSVRQQHGCVRAGHVLHVGAQPLLPFDAVGFLDQEACRSHHSEMPVLGRDHFWPEPQSDAERRRVERRSQESRLQVNLAFNLTLLWQFVGVLYTPAGSQSFGNRTTAESLPGPGGWSKKGGPQEGMITLIFHPFPSDPEGRTLKAVKPRGCLKRLQLAKPRGHLPMLPLQSVCWRSWRQHLQRMVVVSPCHRAT